MLLVDKIEGEIEQVEAAVKAEATKVLSDVEAAIVERVLALEADLKALRKHLGFAA